MLAEERPGLAYQLVQAQSEDGGLWFQAETITEVYLQRALRCLHMAVEHDAGGEKIE